MAVTPANDAFTLNTLYSRRGRSPSPTAVSVGLGKLTRRSSTRALRRASGASGGRALQDIGEDGEAAERAVDWEVPRKTLHASIGFVVVPLYTQGYGARPVVVVLSGALAVILAAEALRLNHAGFARVYEVCLGALMRDSEKHKINGVVWYILGVLIVLSTLPLDIAVVSILLLSWADTAASTFGRLWGRLTPRLPGRVPLVPFLRFARRKSWAGFVAAAATGAVVGGGFWGWVAPLRGGGGAAAWAWGQGALGSWAGLGALGAVTGLVAGVAEALELGPLDDNLTLPVISGWVLWVIMRGMSVMG